MMKQRTLWTVVAVLVTVLPATALGQMAGQVVQTAGPIALPEGSSARVSLFNMCSGEAEVHYVIREAISGDQIVNETKRLAQATGLSVEVRSSQSKDRSMVAILSTRCSQAAFYVPAATLTILNHRELNGHMNLVSGPHKINMGRYDKNILEFLPSN